MNKKWFPVHIGAKVKTTKANLSKKEEWTPEGWARRQWGIEGTVIDRSDGHGLCYEIAHPDGSRGWYDPSEFKILSKGD